MGELEAHHVSFAPALVAPCLLYISQEVESLPSDGEVCARIVQLLRDVKIDWASEALASSLIPHVAVLMRGRHSLLLLSIAMCYSRQLFLEIYKHLLVLLQVSFADVERGLLKDVYCLTYRVYLVAQHVSCMAPYVYSMLHSLYAKCEAPQ